MAKNISLNELARALRINKSQLHYWSKRGLIEPDQVVGKMFIFPEEETKELVKTIVRMRKQGHSIDLIKDKIKKKRRTRKSVKPVKKQKK